MRLLRGNLKMGILRWKFVNFKRTTILYLTVKIFDKKFFIFTKKGE